ncbi:unnamed protein product [Parnassius apollo]|uniref:(apollo) hypothetical protein n=1 Tax=Parnassius apollo TaxID=110799 RepID=A0A8S3X6J0_PARAO|nr:unnamed protein product [Parnassius apollo]
MIRLCLNIWSVFRFTKKQQQSEIESALEEMFGLPSDPDQSEDDEESDEDNVLQYHTAKLQRILEDLDEPGLRSLDIITASPKPSTSSDEPDPRCFFKLQGDREVDMRWVGKWTRNRTEDEKSQDHGDSGSESEVESETNASDEDEDTWNKKLWTD